MTTFYRKPAPSSGAVRPGFTPPTGGGKGDRTLVVRMDAPEVPEHRREGKKPSAKVDRVPDGCLFKVGIGWFDKAGYWCVRKAGGRVEVTRGAPRAAMRKLTDAQRRELARVRLQARRKGLR